MKKIIGIFMMALILCTGMVCPVKAETNVQPLTAGITGYTTHSQTGAVAWMQAQVGKQIDTDGAPADQPYQCVDLIKAYYTYLGVSPVLGNGADFAANALPENWSRIQGAQPQDGDILVWVNGYGGYGHVALYGNGKSYHQNMSGTGSPVSAWNGYDVLNSTYTYWGVIRPDFTSYAKMVPLSGSMYRLYNPNTGEHFYTGSASERNAVLAAGWQDEGIGWTAPVSGDPVYRLYNANSSEHHYTMNYNEMLNLVDCGWDYEGIGWYSDTAHTVPLYRQYNANAFANNHNYTVNANEKNWLLSLGWRDEGIGWYGC